MGGGSRGTHDVNKLSELDATQPREQKACKQLTYQRSERWNAVEPWLLITMCSFSCT